MLKGQIQNHFVGLYHQHGKGAKLGHMLNTYTKVYMGSSMAPSYLTSTNLERSVKATRILKTYLEKELSQAISCY